MLKLKLVMKKTAKSIPQLVKKWWLGLLLVVAIALFLRLIGIDWDAGQHLHPDERFLTMVTVALKWPKNILEYFDPVHSPLNPYNASYNFFVYGRFPVILTKLVSGLFGLDNYGYSLYVGRALSAVFDTSIVLAIFLGVRRLLAASANRTRIALYSALVYAAFVLPIQQSHFYTTDTFVTAFVAWTIVAVLYNRALLAGVFFGLALASKINAVYALPLLLCLLLLQGKKFALRNRIFSIALFMVATYTSLRLFDPYLFQTANYFLPQISDRFLANLREMQGMSVRGTFYPPGIQWYTKDIFFGLRNIFWYGVGPVYFLLTLLGAFLASRKFKLNRTHVIVGLYVLWCTALFSYQSLQFVKSIRYYYLVYPFIAVGAGYALSQINLRFLRAGIFFLGFIWTAAFVHIYTVPHSRITASRWMYENIPAEKSIGMETWDDPLPLLFPDTPMRFTGIELEVFWPDSAQGKWDILSKKLSHADYISLSSNRAWGSIMSAPEYYPLGSKYYEKLFAGKLGFKEVARFTSYPMLDFGFFRIEFPDDNAEEAFTVYDHPQVRIFRREPSFSVKKFMLELKK